MGDLFGLYLPDTGPDTRILVTYEPAAGSTCVLPCRFVGYEEDGDLLVEVEHVDTRTGDLLHRSSRRIAACTLRSVQEVRDEDV